MHIQKVTLCMKSTKQTKIYKEKKEKKRRRRKPRRKLITKEERITRCESLSR